MKKWLLVGVGNSLRGDDGAGAYICAEVANLRIPGLATMITQQLYTELAEDFMQYDAVIIADASVQAKEVVLTPLTENKKFAVTSFTHEVHASAIAILMQQLYKKEIPFYLCEVPALHFDLTESLSRETKQFANQAVQLIKQLIEK